MIEGTRRWEAERQKKKGEGRENVIDLNRLTKWLEALVNARSE